MLNKFLKHERGITGLETAIILIAFVVVAAVFAYTALSAGLFSTQKAQEAVYSGLKEAQSTLEIKGGIIAKAGTVGGDNGTVKTLSFVVANALGGESIDFTEPADGSGGLATGASNKVVINYSDKNQTRNNLYWSVTKLGDDSGDYQLNGSEKYQITIGSDNATKGSLLNALSPTLGVNTTFKLYVITPAGASLTLERTTPAYIDSIVDLR